MWFVLKKKCIVFMRYLNVYVFIKNENIYFVWIWNFYIILKFYNDLLGSIIIVFFCLIGREFNRYFSDGFILFVIMKCNWKFSYGM